MVTGHTQVTDPWSRVTHRSRTHGHGEREDDAQVDPQVLHVAHVCVDLCVCVMRECHKDDVSA
jgi:hypothetical protein